jgi:hypothetical protein
VLLNPRELNAPFVEHTATSELHLSLRTVGDELPHVFLQLPHPLDSRVHDANLRLETICVEQQAKAACLFGDASREFVCSTLRVKPERHPTPGDESEIPGARPRRRGVPIDERHRQTRSKDGIPRGEIEDMRRRLITVLPTNSLRK